MILEIRPLSAGNALQVFLRPPAGSERVRLLRKPVDTITSETDATALVAYEGGDTVIVDAEPGLVNQQPMFYRAFYFVGGAWMPSASTFGTPAATYSDASTDVQSLLRERLEKGLAVEVVRGALRAGQSGAIATLTSPPIAEETDWPVVTVQLESESPSVRGVGELLDVDSFDTVSGRWVESEGYLADVRCVVSAWCLNPDERIEFRKALRRILVANFPVFDAAGMVEVTMQASDADFLNGEFGSNVFQTNIAFSCVAPVIVRDEQDPVVDVSVTAIPAFN